MKDAFANIFYEQWQEWHLIVLEDLGVKGSVSGPRQLILRSDGATDLDTYPSRTGIGMWRVSFLYGHRRRAPPIFSRGVES